MLQIYVANWFVGEHYGLLHKFEGTTFTSR